MENVLWLARWLAGNMEDDDDDDEDVDCGNDND